MTLPTGFSHSSSPSRYIAMRSTRSSGGTPTVNEHSPMPWRPISRCPSALLVAPHSGGCGFCSGLGCTRRRLRAADRVVVRLGEQAHAVPEAHRGRLRRDGAVEHLGVRAVRVLLEEVMLDGPEGVETRLLAENGLLERVLVRGVLLAVGEGLGDRNLVEQRELHGPAPPS